MRLRLVAALFLLCACASSRPTAEEKKPAPDPAQTLALQAAQVKGDEEKARALLQQGEAAEAAAPAEALRAYARARSAAASSAASAQALSAQGKTTAATTTAADADGKLSALLGKLVLTVVEGDRQRGSAGKPLAQPIVVTAWMAGKRAAGLPLAASVAGARADGASGAALATVDEAGRASVRVEDLGKLDKAEQEIEIGPDWARLADAPAGEAPAWSRSLPKSVATAVALRRGVETTRVLVLLFETIDGGSLSERPVSLALDRALKRGGFDVQDAAPILAKFGAERLIALSDAQLKDAARRVADVVVVGTATGRAASAGAATARADLRALDLGTGQVVFQAPQGESKSRRAGPLGVAGRSALEALGEALAPGLTKALRTAAAQ